MRRVETKNYNAPVMTDSRETFLRLDAVSTAFSNKTVLHGVTFSLHRQGVGCLLGPSGCGKTTLLRCLAGFQALKEGTIHLAGTLLSSVNFHVPIEKRQVGMVFQERSLFPHLNIEQNIAFGLRKIGRKPLRHRVDQLLSLVGLEHCKKSYPHELSGGEQQRIELARALAPQPRLLLLDEPFSGLDPGLRLQLADEVKKLIKKQKTTALFVTHDQNEALALADYVGVMSQGRLLQWETAYNLYHRPNSRDVATFVGMGSLLAGQLIAEHKVRTVLGDFPLEKSRKIDKNERLSVLVRPDDIVHDDDSSWQATVVTKQFRGAEFLYQLALKNGETVHCLAPSHHDHRIGEAIGIRVDMQHTVAFSETLTVDGQVGRADTLEVKVR